MVIGKDPKAQDARLLNIKYKNILKGLNLGMLYQLLGLQVQTKLKRLSRSNGTIDYDKADSNGTTIKQYVDSMNNLIAEEFMTMEIPMETFTVPSTVAGPPTPPVIAKQRDNQQVFAAQILDAMTKANAGGMRPSFESQVPAEAGDFAEKVAETKVRRGEIR